MSDATKVLSFGQDAGGSSSLFVAEIDGEMHRDADGNEKRSFLPGEEVFVLLHHASEVKVKRVTDTAGGELQRIGEVSRSRMVEMTFTHPDDRQDLPHIPTGVPAARWYGRTSGLVLDSRQVGAAGAPCLGELSYSFSAVQYRYRPPAGMMLAAGEKFPVDLIIETEG